MRIEGHAEGTIEDAHQGSFPVRAEMQWTDHDPAVVYMHLTAGREQVTWQVARDLLVTGMYASSEGGLMDVKTCRVGDQVRIVIVGDGRGSEFAQTILLDRHAVLGFLLRTIRICPRAMEAAVYEDMIAAELAELFA